MKRTTPLHRDGGRFISFPAVRRQGEGVAGDTIPALQEIFNHHAHFGVRSAMEVERKATRGGGAADAAGDAGGGAAAEALGTHAGSDALHTGILPVQTHGAMALGSAQALQRMRAEQHFPVSLTVIAIGDGVIERTTQPKLLHRLKHVMNKVPKEHHCHVDLPKHGAVPLRLRLFVTNSEDAKAACEKW